MHQAYLGQWKTSIPYLSAYGLFAPEVQTALKIIAAEERTTMQALLAEAINAVFAKRHKPEIAEIQAN